MGHGLLRWSLKPNITSIARLLANVTGLVNQELLPKNEYNPIERRLFSAISRNWAGEPLHSYEKILKFIRTTTTNTGLKVRAFLDRKDYPVGVKPSPARMREIHITRHNCAPRWNYTITPRM